MPKSAKTKSILRGMASVVSFGRTDSSKSGVRPRPEGTKTDVDAMAGDWERVGSDIAKAADDYARGGK